MILTLPLSVPLGFLCLFVSCPHPSRHCVSVPNRCLTVSVCGWLCQGCAGLRRTVADVSLRRMFWQLPHRRHAGRTLVPVRQRRGGRPRPRRACPLFGLTLNPPVCIHLSICAPTQLLSLPPPSTGCEFPNVPCWCRVLAFALSVDVSFRVHILPLFMPFVR